jgi:hypothetical protein
VGFLRQVQHKPQRDEQKSKELIDTKRENQHLKKQIVRLRKQIAKMVDQHGLDMPPTIEEVEVPEVIVETKPEPENRCERCGGSTRLIEVGGKIFMACECKCGWKKLIKTTEAA